MTTWLNNHDEIADESHLPERTVAGSVLRATRLSAALSRKQLATTAGVTEQTIHSFEIGREPLASLPVTQLDSLKDALRSAGAHDQLIADLEPALWCDAVLSAIAEHDDVRCLLADPLAREPAFGELIAWAVSGLAPARYAPFRDGSVNC